MKNTKRFPLFVLAVLLTAAFTLSGLGEAVIGPNMRVVNCKEYVSLREKPSTSAKRLIKVPLGAEVLVWLDGGDDSDTEGFLYCEYNGLQGYILSEYLEPITEKYHTGLGFSFLYNPYRLRPDQTMSESGKSVLVDWISQEDVPAYLELMLPEVLETDPQQYLETNADFTDTYTTPSGVTVTWGARTNEDYTLSYGFYIITREDNAVLAFTTISTDLEEVIEPDFSAVLFSIAFE